MQVYNTKSAVDQINKDAHLFIVLEECIDKTKTENDALS